MEHLTKLKQIIPDEFWNDINRSQYQLRSHPIAKLVNELENNHSLFYKQRAEKLLEVILQIQEKHPYYFHKTWYNRILRTKDHYNEAIGTLGEYRCRQILEESGFKVNEIPEANNKKTPDFVVQDHTGKNLYIEVMTPRMNAAAQKKLEEFHSSKDSIRRNKDEVTLTVRSVIVNPISEVSKTKNRRDSDRVIELYKRLLSNKGTAGQTVKDAINILWLNFEDSELSINKGDVYPCSSSPFKDMYQTGNFGIWQMFYGKKGSSIFKDRTWLKYYEGSSYEKTIQKNDGYFRESHKWAGVIMSFNDCQVFFQNPWSSIEIPVKTKQLIMRLENFDLNASWVDENNGFLLEKVESKVNEFERIHQIFEH